MKKIIVDINGRFGNHLHQILAGKSIAIDYGLDFYANSNNNHWAYESYLETKIPLLDISSVPHERIGIPATEHMALEFKLEHTHVSSYFMNYKWHLHNRDFLIDWIKFNPKYIEKAKKVFEAFVGQYTCAIHVRRDDYVALDYYPLVAEEYYRKVVALTKEKNPVYIVCSDDIAWCKQFFSQMEGNFYFSENDFLVDFLLMSMCNCNAIANSSFSYFAAYFNRNCEQVFYPHIWSWYFAEDGKAIGDLCPPNWTKVEY
jgi:hypothetical protein